ncbi:Multidrug resistance-associated protein 4 [Trachymyrmex cornetzi]|uniref:Multidrug resistance-associated protein 4 n=1 Tax=Trachymyrmex cornetzi TaxID=471704 RepID=A0A195E1F2_9HYME|nr:Multidrug resistance-associated protein 4 [Trachymyrmex cornetzi]
MTISILWIFFTSSVMQNDLLEQATNKSLYEETSYLYYECWDEREINLNDGQLAKINLAQAIYKDTDTYMTDDPLFMDSYVSRHLVDKCICSIIFKGTSGTVQQNVYIVMNKKIFAILKFL